MNTNEGGSEAVGLGDSTCRVCNNCGGLYGVVFMGKACICGKNSPQVEVEKKMKLVPHNWEDTVAVNVIANMQAQNDRLKARCEAMEKALEKIMNELGIPQADYPAPISNAYRIALDALK